MYFTSEKLSGVYQSAAWKNTLSKWRPPQLHVEALVIFALITCLLIVCLPNKYDIMIRFCMK